MFAQLVGLFGTALFFASYQCRDNRQLFRVPEKKAGVLWPTTRNTMISSTVRIMFRAAIRGCRCPTARFSSRPSRRSPAYFRPDERKEGGAYLTVTGVVRKLNPAARRIIMQDGTVIPAAEISAMEGEIFSDMDEW